MNVEELADILEIVHALIELNDFQLEDVEQVRKSKQEKRGAFKQGFFLEHVID
jgi:predicted house-cleaning noncanonical NTP pyrophosphatase (MazG superfamily)